MNQILLYFLFAQLLRRLAKISAASESKLSQGWAYCKKQGQDAVMLELGYLPDNKWAEGKP